MVKVIVASTNPVKINATLLGFQKMFPNEKFEIIGKSASSEVSEQPLSNEETLTGAKNRAENVSKLEEADYWVGIEGGVHEKDAEMEVIAWTVVKSKSGKFGRGRAASFILPKKISELIKNGMELGAADDQVFGDLNSKQKSGTIGKLTDGVIDRTTYYIDAVALALIPFKNPDLY